jgi:hypothetical protein
MYVNAKMILVQTIPGIGRGGKERAMEGVNSTMIYLIHYMNLCKSTMYPHPAHQ